MTEALRQLDLNLLVVLDALLREGSATRASARLGVTQSAVSHALARLRESLGDPLLVRAPGGLVPTARGEALREPVARALGELGAALAPAVFEPATARGEIRISSPDYAAILLFPAVVQRLALLAPGLDLVLRQPMGDPFEPLAAGESDLALGTSHTNADGFYAQRLWADDFCCVLRRGHPLADHPWDVDTYCALRHVLVTPTGSPGGVVDVQLESLGRTRRVVARVPHFVGAVYAVAGSDAIATLPRRVAARFAASLSLEVRPPPLAVPGFSIAQFWHARRHADPAHRWVRDVLLACAATL